MTMNLQSEIKFSFTAEEHASIDTTTDLLSQIADLLEERGAAFDCDSEPDTLVDSDYLRHVVEVIKELCNEEYRYLQ